MNSFELYMKKARMILERKRGCMLGKMSILANKSWAKVKNHKGMDLFFFVVSEMNVPGLSKVTNFAFDKIRDEVVKRKVREYLEKESKELSTGEVKWVAKKMCSISEQIARNISYLEELEKECLVLVELADSERGFDFEKNTSAALALANIEHYTTKIFSLTALWICYSNKIDDCCIAVNEENYKMALSLFSKVDLAKNGRPRSEAVQLPVRGRSNAVVGSRQGSLDRSSDKYLNVSNVDHMQSDSSCKMMQEFLFLDKEIEKKMEELLQDVNFVNL